MFRSSSVKPILFLGFFWMLAPYSNAQVSPDYNEDRTPVSHFHSVDFGEAPTASSVEAYLTTRFLSEAPVETQLSLVSSVQSLGGWHYLYNQTVNAVPIYGAQIKVNTDFNNRIVSIFDGSYSPQHSPSQDFPGKVEINDFFNSLNEDLDFQQSTLVYWEENGVLIPAIQLEWGSSNETYQEAVLDANGSILFQRDRLLYAAAPLALDTPATALVFGPDPLTSAGVPYGAPYIDDNDNDSPLLNNERISVTLDVTYDNGMYILENDFVKITDHSSPNLPPATSTTPDFSFTRTEAGFEDVMVLYHITEYQLWMQSLGFTNLVDYQIHADPHGFNSADQSNFNPSSTPPRLTFGEGGVDDAEDADVIIHEYGHAISHSAAPNTNLGTQRSALDEALGDYLAASYSRSYSNFGHTDVFNWDGHNEFWSGRTASSTKHYPEDIVNNLYTDTDIWSATIMQIQNDIGREKADRLLLESLFGYTSHMSMAQAAMLYVQADELLYGGANRTPICDRFNQRGLLDFCTVGIDEEEALRSVELRNTEGFTNRDEPALLHFGQAVSGFYQIVDLQGRVVKQVSWNNTQDVAIPSSELPAGAYLLTTQWKQNQQTFKLLVQPN